MKRSIAADQKVVVVSPVYNERDNVTVFFEEVAATFARLELACPFEIVFVNDGSKDGSGEVLDALSREHPDKVKVVHLARNFGHAAAVTAGVDYAHADIVIIMDSDLQDDPAAFGPFLEKWREGYDVVYAIRASRTEPFWIRFSSWLFYRLLGWIADVDIPLDAGDFALLDGRVADTLRKLPERNRYFPGLRSWVGFKQTGVPVPRRSRYDTRSRVGLRGLWTRSMNAVFSFSYVPLFFFRLAGCTTLVLSFAMILWALYHKLVVGVTIKAWTSQFVTTLFLGGINLLGIGVLGEYVARIYDEVKMRPVYIVARHSEDIESQQRGRNAGSAEKVG